MNPGDLLGTLTVDQTPIFGRFNVSDFSFDDAFI
jgi:hypothetical protein